MDTETVEEVLERQLVEKQKLLGDCKEQLETTKTEMTELKAKLYGEFGDRINLDK